MGQCAGRGPKDGADEISRQKHLDKMLADKQRTKKLDDLAVTKLLLVGTGESGKSTLFKQIVYSYGEGVGVEERKAHVLTIHNNIIKSMQILYTQANLLKSEVKVDADDEFFRQLAEFKDPIPLSLDRVEKIKTLWAHPFMKELYALRFGRFYIMDSAEYFLDKVSAVIREDYLPSEADIIRIRAPTTGIHQTEFQILGSTMLLVDVGGQRNERRKWLNCFDGVTAVLFVVGLSEYDQTLYEDATVNRLVESLNTFDSIVNSGSLSRISVILLLNKRDLFEQKIKKVPLSFALPSYDGPVGDFSSAVTYIEDEFRKLNRYSSRSIYAHVTCATDTELVRKLFESIRDTIIKISLDTAALA